MKVQLEHILQSLFHKPSLEEVDVDELKQLVKEHPYFSTGHFLLAQKLKHQNGNGEQQSQRAALYFHDPLWMHWQLKQFANGNEIDQQQVVAPVDTNIEDEENEQLLTWDQPIEEQRVVEKEEPIEEEEPVEETDPIEHEEPLAPEEELAVETIGPVEEAIPAEPETAEVAEHEQAVEYNSPADETTSFHEPEESPAPLVSEQQPLAVEDPVIEHAAAPEEPKPSEPSQPVIQREEAALPAFDPYYTIDYFASQGIKAPVEVQPGDKLGRQLKSFTEWLKTMKRLPQAQTESVSDESEQQHIRQVAAHSLEQKEVVTETMAEVLVKQGKNTEAIAIYDKLSLLDPSKSAYFAAKIENLKENRP